MQPDGLAAEHHSLAFHWDRQVELVHCIVFMSYQVQVFAEVGNLSTRFGSNSFDWLCNVHAMKCLYGYDHSTC